MLPSPGSSVVAPGRAVDPHLALFMTGYWALGGPAPQRVAGGERRGPSCLPPAPWGHCPCLPRPWSLEPAGGTAQCPRDVCVSSRGPAALFLVLRGTAGRGGRRQKGTGMSSSPTGLPADIPALSPRAGATRALFLCMRRQPAVAPKQAWRVPPLCRVWLIQPQPEQRHLEQE